MKGNVLHLGRIIEAIDPKEGEAPDRWRVRIIDAGMSHNRANYPLKVLHEAAKAFEGRPVLIRDDELHLQDRGKNVRNIGGWITDVTPVAEGLDGTLNIAADHAWLKSKVFDAFSKGKRDLFGLSIVAEAAWSRKRDAVGFFRDVTRIVKVRSVDAVVDPSAGGKFVGLAEACERGALEEMKTKLLLIEAKLPDKYKALDLDNLDEAKVDELFAEAVTLAAKPAGKPAAAAVDVQGIVAEAAKEAARVVSESLTKQNAEERARERALATLDRLFAESKLPADAKPRLQKIVEATEKPADEAFIAEAIKGEREYLAKHANWTGPRSTSGGLMVEADEVDKLKAATLGFFMEADQPLDPKNPTGAKVPRETSIRRLYQNWTGDIDITGRVENAPRVGLTAEAAIQAGTFAYALVDAMHVAMQSAYRTVGYDEWRQIARVVPVSDFRTNHRPQIGGFGDLSTVAETGEYLEIGTSPTDFGPSYSIGKKGNIKAITLEMIANDQSGVVRQFPQKLGAAAKRTMSAGVWNTLLTNGNVSWEAVALCAAAHGNNITTDPLSAEAIAAGRVVMAKQTEPNSNARLGLRPKHLVVAEEAAQKAWELTSTDYKPVLDQSSAAAVENGRLLNFIRQYGLQPLVCPHAADPYKWWMVADNNFIDTIEVGFYGGRQEPELFIQDMPNVGSMFTNDQVTMKIRFIYGICYLDWRPFYFGNAAA